MNCKTIIISITCLLFLSGCTRSSSDKGIEIFPDMVHAVPYEAFSASDITANGQSMQQEVPNTIARGRMPFTYGKGESEAKRAGRELKSPYKQTAKTLERGREVYTNYCLVCHGPKGKGDGPLIPKFPNPPSLTSKRLRKYKDGRIFHIITRGSGDMQSHGSQIDYKDRWFLVQYVNWIQETYKKK